MKILVRVDGSAPANRAVAHAIRMIRGRPEAEIILVSVQDRETLDVSDISAVMTVEADRASAARQSKEALRKAVALCRKAEVKFESRAEIGPIAATHFTSVTGSRARWTTSVTTEPRRRALSVPIPRVPITI
jgi:Universal stress protein family